MITTSTDIWPRRSKPSAPLVSSMANDSVPSTSSSSIRLTVIIASLPPVSKLISPDTATKSSPSLAVPETDLYWTVTASCTLPERMTSSS